MADPSTYRPKPGTVPKEPGVYRFRDESGVVIYVGKAKSLRSRLASYFADPARLHPRTAAMVQTACSVDWVTVDSELEALQLEYTWIKEFRPRFNVLFKDDKSHPYLVLTMSQEFPAAYVSRAKKVKGNRYFGPYVHAWALRETLDQLLRVFPVRTCSQGVYQRHQRIGRPCLLGDIGKCSAPCVGRIDKESYDSMIDDMTAFMSGRSDQFIREAKKAMLEASENQDYERAAVLRDELLALQTVQEKSAIVLPDNTDADVVVVEPDELQAAFEVFHVRGGRVTGQRSTIVERPIDDTVADVVHQFLVQFYGLAAEDQTVTVPPEILVNVNPTSVELVSGWLRESGGRQVEIRIPQRGPKKALVETVKVNARQALALHKLKRGSDLTTRSLALDELQGALGLRRSPLRIECIDISSHHGTDIVGSLVVFEDALAKKSDYRSYNIPDGADDLSSLRQVITRRFAKRLTQEEESAQLSPANSDDVQGAESDDEEIKRSRYDTTLLVVDGGSPQVNAAADALSELGITDLDVVGLAKRLEEVWLPGQEDPLIMSRRSEALYLLQRLRDESHRFAIDRHRKRRTAKIKKSALDDIPGLGAKRRADLLKRFGSIKKLKEASVDDIQAVPGIGPQLAQVIVEHLQ
ncbi:MAG: excinuclease ABC subunit UvrC [Candidatus Nanopelagicales bacterium]